MAVGTQFGVIIVGGGPAGIAVLLSAHQDGRLPQLLEEGLLVIERSANVGDGTIGRYLINSDSTGETFIASLRAGPDGPLKRILKTAVARRISAAGSSAVSLRDVGALMLLIGDAMRELIEVYPQSHVMTSTCADSARQLKDGTWRINAQRSDGSDLSLHTKCLVLATGATQPLGRLARETFAGTLIMQRWGTKVMQSGEVLANGGLEAVARRLRLCSRPKIAILGGSTSAMSVAHTLLHRLENVSFGAGSITLFHRRPLRVYYTSVQEAWDDGYSEFSDEDLCPVTQRVYRLAGFRLDSRELLMRVKGIGNRPPEPRLVLCSVESGDYASRCLIDACDLVVTAFGYRPNALQLLDSQGKLIPLYAETGPAASLVDDACRVLDGNGEPISGVFGIGLAAGFVPHGTLGGEPSFSGQANGLWLWQNDIGAIIVDAVLSSPHTYQLCLDETSLHKTTREDLNQFIEKRNASS